MDGLVKTLANMMWSILVDNAQVWKNDKFQPIAAALLQNILNAQFAANRKRIFKISESSLTFEALADAIQASGEKTDSPTFSKLAAAPLIEKESFDDAKYLALGIIELYSGSDSPPKDLNVIINAMAGSNHSVLREWASAKLAKGAAAPKPATAVKTADTLAPPQPPHAVSNIKLPENDSGSVVTLRIFIIKPAST